MSGTSRSHQAWSSSVHPHVKYTHTQEADELKEKKLCLHFVLQSLGDSEGRPPGQDGISDSSRAG